MQILIEGPKLKLASFDEIVDMQVSEKVRREYREGGIERDGWMNVVLTINRHMPHIHVQFQRQFGLL